MNKANKMPSPQKTNIETGVNNLTNEQLESYVLNETNKPITSQFIESLLKKFGITHKVQNLKRFQTAMIHSSYLHRDLKNDRLAKLVHEKDLKPIPESMQSSAMPLCDVSYERLEFVGDSVIHFVLADYLHERYPDEQEGFMTRLRTKIESGATLAKLSKRIGLNEYVVIARNIEQIGGRENNYHILEDAFEAFIGALYYDTSSSFDKCKQLLTKLIEEYVDMSSLIHNETNYKDTLLQCYHRWRWPDPEYGSRGVLDNNNKRTFLMYVKGIVVNSGGEKTWEIVGEGSGSSKKRGEQESAKQALIKFGIIKPDSGDDNYEEIIDENDFNYE